MLKIIAEQFKLLLVSALCHVFALVGAAEQLAPFAPGEVLIAYRDHAAPTVPWSSKSYLTKYDGQPDVSKILQQHKYVGVQRLTQSPSGKAYGSRAVDRVVFPAGTDVQQVIKQLSLVGSVLYAEPNYLGTLAYTPGDPLYGQQSGDFAHAKIEEGWQAQINGGGSAGSNPSVVVAVVDSGMDAQHVDLANAVDVVNSYNFTDGNTLVFDDLAHGTRVAGIIAAQANNGNGIAGVAFGAKLLSLDVATSVGVVSAADVAAAVDHARVNGANIINLSLRFNADSQTLRDACAAAAASGILLVASAGNENQGDSPVYPASYPGVLGVGALAEDGVSRASFSNYNGLQTDLVDLFAPGQTIFSTIPGSLYNGISGSGTSFAAPIVSGIAALLKTKYPVQGGGALRAHLLATASGVGPNYLPAGSEGSGIVNAEEALQTALEPALTINQISVDDNTELDPDNNGDGTLDADETALVTVVIANSAGDASGVAGTLSTVNATCTVTGAGASWGTIANGAAQSPLAGFVVQVNQPTAAEQIAFSLDVTANSGAYVAQFPFVLSVEDEQPISSNTTFVTPQSWTADTTYVVEGQLTVLDDLTIEPGTTVRLKPEARIEVSGGTLTAVGTEESPIRFLPYMEEQNPDIQDEDFLWAKAQPTNDEGWANAVHTLPDGGVVSVGMLKGQTVFGEGETSQTLVTATMAGNLFISRYSPNGQLLWVRSIGSTTQFNPSHATGVTSSSDGTILVCGYFLADCVFGAGEPNETSFTGIAEDSFFIAKYESNGDLRWVKTGVSADDSIATAIAPTSDGGAIITGGYETAFTLGQGEPNQITLPASGAGEIFVARFTSNGSLVWAKRAGSTNTLIADSGLGVATFPDDGCIVTGIIRGTATFGSGETAGVNQAGPTSLVASANDAFVARLNSDGTLRWAKRAGGTGADRGIGAAAAADGTSYITGDFSSVSMIVGPGEVSGPGQAGATTLVRSGSTDTWLAKYNPNGSLTWARQISSTAEERPRGIAMLPDNSIVLTGFYRAGGSALTFPPASSHLDLISVGEADVFMARYSSAGEPLWSKRVGGAGNDVTGGTFGPGAIHANAKGEFSIAGAFGGNGITTADRAVFGVGEERETVLHEPSGFSPYVAKYAGQYGWSGLTITNSAVAAQLEHCIFERGGVINHNASTSIANCAFNRAPVDGLLSTAGTSAITSCTAEVNRFSGFILGQRAAQDCSAEKNRAHGIVTSGTVTASSATSSVLYGIVAHGVTGSEATFCRGTGVVTYAGATLVQAAGNGRGVLCASGDAISVTAQQNTGFGITITGGGVAEGCLAKANGGGGLSTDGATIANCIADHNTGPGITGSGSSAATSCWVSGNGGAAFSGVASVIDCTAVANGNGVVGATTVTGLYSTQNSVSGITGGTVNNSSILGNSGVGVYNSSSVGNSWVVGNTGTGVVGTYTGAVVNSTVSYNLGGGVQDLSSAGTTQSNLFGNDIFDAKDTEPRSFFQTKNFIGNYWGPRATTDMAANPFPFDIDPEIQDGYDLGAVQYLDYSNHSTLPVANAPDATPPAFVLDITPDVTNPISVGATTFTLTFSSDMDQSQDPAVTFGLEAPFTQYVVLPSPGWLSSRTWQGTFNIQGDTPNGINHVRVSGALSFQNRLLPDDTRFRFIIDVGGLGANNGLVTGSTGSYTDLSWTENNKSANIIGYRVVRKPFATLDTEYKAVSGIVPASTYRDESVSPSSQYTYKIYSVASDFSEAQWTPPFSGGTTSSIGDWSAY